MPKLPGITTTPAELWSEPVLLESGHVSEPGVPPATDLELLLNHEVRNTVIQHPALFTYQTVHTITFRTKLPLILAQGYHRSWQPEES